MPNKRAAESDLFGAPLTKKTSAEMFNSRRRSRCQYTISEGHQFQPIDVDALDNIKPPALSTYPTPSIGSELDSRSVDEELRAVAKRTIENHQNPATPKKIDETMERLRKQLLNQTVSATQLKLTHIDSLKDLQEKHEKSLKVLRDDLTKQTALKADLEEALETKSTQMKEVHTKFKDKLNELNTKHKLKVTELQSKREHNKEIRECKASAELKIKGMIREHREALRKRESDWKVEKTTLTVRHQEDEKLWKAKLSDQIKESKDELKKGEAVFKEELKKREEAHKEELAKLRSEKR